MIYQAYQNYSDMLDPLRALAQAVVPALRRPIFPETPRSELQAMKRMAAACEVFARLRLTHERPAFGIESVFSGGKQVGITEEVVDRTPFGSLLRFRKDNHAIEPKVLLVAPLSGHFATLLRGTVRTMVQDHDVYITDWHNARDVPLAQGTFGLDDYIEHLIRFIGVLGPGSHVMAVCQPTVGALAAVSLMAQQEHPAQPRTMTLMAGPIDTRINPTSVNELATTRPIEWFEKNLISRVPLRHAGAMRRVYPGFLQITAFMSMNLDRHAKAFMDLYRMRVEGDEERAEVIGEFYREYFAMMDLPAEFYLQTVQTIFQDHDLPLGRLKYRDQVIDPSAIRRTALLTIEGEKDDICSVGQTLAAQDLCSGIRPYSRRHHVQTGVGHYGVFNGRRWERHIYPIVRDFIFFGA